MLSRRAGLSATAGLSCFCLGDIPGKWTNYHVTMPECVNWFSNCFNLSVDNYRVEQLCAKVVSPRSAQRNVSNQ